MPYATIIGSVLSNTADPYLETEPRNIKLFLKDVIHHDRNIDGCVMLNDKFVTDISWYCKAIELENIPVKLTKFENLDPCWKLIVCLPNEQKIIENKYNTQKLDSFKTVITYQLGGLKEK